MLCGTSVARELLVHVSQMKQVQCGDLPLGEETWESNTWTESALVDPRINLGSLILQLLDPQMQIRHLTVQLLDLIDVRLNSLIESPREWIWRRLNSRRSTDAVLYHCRIARTDLSLRRVVALRVLQWH